MVDMKELTSEELVALDAMKLPFALKLRKSFGIGKGCSVKTLFLVARNNAIQNHERFIENSELKRRINQQAEEIKRLAGVLEEVHSHYIAWSGFCPILHKRIKGLLDVVSKNRKYSGS